MGGRDKFKAYLFFTCFTTDIEENITICTSKPPMSYAAPEAGNEVGTSE